MRPVLYDSILSFENYVSREIVIGKSPEFTNTIERKLKLFLFKITRL